MVNVEVTTRGDVSDHAREQARKEIGALERFVKGPVLGARVVLIQETNPRIPTPARAELSSIFRVGSSARAPPHRQCKPPSTTSRSASSGSCGDT
jgi:hypothetical protein